MNRRTFVRSVAGSAVMLSVPEIMVRSATARAADIDERLNKSYFRKLADIALSTARKLGASYADIRVCRYHHQSISTREERVEGINEATDFGFGVRVLVDGTWGFSSSNNVTEAQIEKVARAAVEMARANKLIQKMPVELEKLPAYHDEWIMPMKSDPFTISIEEKVSKLLAINEAARKAGANFCNSAMSFVKEDKHFASGYGSLLFQSRVRCFPNFNVTAIDKESGKFATRHSLAAPRGSGYEYVREYDWVGEATTASEEARRKLKAKPVEAGKKDLLIHPTNLWLTIHESIGHPCELDRALGYEANFAGTSFVTPEKLDKLRYGSEFITIVGDRTQKGGLSTVAYDDDGVRTKGAEFNIITKGRFTNYEMAIGQAAKIGRKRSNGCSFADGWDTFPIQRMPNISLQPGRKKISIEELASDIKDGIYIIGNGSWSIDQQRYNFQFGGQVFYEIKKGKIGQMLREVAYQGNTVDFWNACDGICGEDQYYLGGAFNCGKGQPQQIAPVSHGAVPARFRQINVLNTERKDI
ncbi:MAG TPA: TldD/PmbA family protein [Verrucomicrobiae bacterium]|nr:TldD/PmbA family protein [Verrucomicrobiae bacterium]